MNTFDIRSCKAISLITSPSSHNGSCYMLASIVVYLTPSSVLGSSEKELVDVTFDVTKAPFRRQEILDKASSGKLPQEFENVLGQLLTLWDKAHTQWGTHKSSTNVTFFAVFCSQKNTGKGLGTFIS